MSPHYFYYTNDFTVDHMKYRIISKWSKSNFNSKVYSPSNFMRKLEVNDFIMFSVFFRKTFITKWNFLYVSYNGDDSYCSSIKCLWLVKGYFQNNPANSKSIDPFLSNHFRPFNGELSYAPESFQKSQLAYDNTFHLQSTDWCD